ncbi:MAG TPA: PDR/VanB family oxidoreductase [Nocardioides sp.]|uniref:PDR/VanB family oxidoreductase n=1 Tax=uncultured Nocardioides sp. TaxID=198441 RepID=UPI000ED867D7|nr:PDR/VanB family oxidoreductase [uncultured Nocardioides sp.]HCB03260.1 oxidoreductase [Nocardioides sp.]HRI93992.1 PDR/VanB family oxidoreductase [Nocardioides sp.]HRK44006.1 PDR/VanB family oxidoreductase [Nocardioides sp.]
MSLPAVDDASSPVATERNLLLQVARREVRGDVAVLELREAGGGVLPSWAPGAHVDLVLGADLVRQYSLCGGLHDDTWRIAVLLVAHGRGGSRFVFDKLGTGAVVEARGPRNRFPLTPAREYVFLAGGIGITPLIPMIEDAEAAGANWVLHYGARTRQDMFLAGELLNDHPDRVRLFPKDECGLIPFGEIMRDVGPDALVYCCGPEPMLDAAEEAAAWCGSAERLRVERFQPRARPQPTSEREFEVVLAKSGLTVTVPPGQSILESLTKVGVNVLSSCNEGTCGTCETFIVEGTPDHRDTVLTPEEQACGDSLMVCVSRSASRRLVLDL